jgi:hypothetical protein
MAKVGILKDSTPGPIDEPVPFHYKRDRTPTSAWFKCFTKSINTLIPYTAEELCNPMSIGENLTFMAWVKLNAENLMAHSEYLSKECEGRESFTIDEWFEMIRASFNKGPLGKYIFQGNQPRRAVKNMILRLMVTPLSHFPNWDPETSIFTSPTQLEVALLAGRQLFGDVYGGLVEVPEPTQELDILTPAPQDEMVYTKSSHYHLHVTIKSRNNTTSKIWPKMTCKISHYRSRRNFICI